MFTLGEVMLTSLVAGVVGTGLSAAEPARERPRLWVRRIAGVRGSFLAHRPWRHDDGAWGEVQTSRNHGPAPLGPGKALLKAVPTSPTRAGLPRPGIDFPHRIRESVSLIQPLSACARTRSVRYGVVTRRRQACGGCSGCYVCAGRAASVTKQIRPTNSCHRASEARRVEQLDGCAPSGRRPTTRRGR